MSAAGASSIISGEVDSGTFVVLLCAPLMLAAVSNQSNVPNLSQLPISTNVRMDILSEMRINAITGQFATVRVNMTSLSSNEIASGIACISIVDLNNSVPIDLEDWSAQKGVFKSSIAPGHHIALEWSIRLVKGGSYTVDVLFGKEGDLSSPVSSPRVSSEIAPKINLNTSNVLPVAFGVPALRLSCLRWSITGGARRWEFMFEIWRGGGRAGPDGLLMTCVVLTFYGVARIFRLESTDL